MSAELLLPARIDSTETQVLSYTAHCSLLYPSTPSRPLLAVSPAPPPSRNLPLVLLRLTRFASLRLSKASGVMSKHRSDSPMGEKVAGFWGRPGSQSRSTSGSEKGGGGSLFSGFASPSLKVSILSKAVSLASAAAHSFRRRRQNAAWSRRVVEQLALISCYIYAGQLCRGATLRSPSSCRWRILPYTRPQR